MPDPRRRSRGESGPPTSYPKGDPPAPSLDHSFTLQAVMQMQKDLGILGEKIDRMREDFVDLKADGKETREKVHGVEKSIAQFKGAIVVFGGLYTLALVIIGAFLTWYLKQPAPAPPAVNPVIASQPEQATLHTNGAVEATPTRRR